MKAAGGANLWLQSIGYKFTELDRVDYAKHLLVSPGPIVGDGFGQAAKPRRRCGGGRRGAAAGAGASGGAAAALAAVLREQQERGAADAAFAAAAVVPSQQRGCRRRLETSRAPCWVAASPAATRRRRRRRWRRRGAVAVDGAQLVVREGITGVVFAAEQGIFAEYLARRLFGVPASRCALEAIHRARDSIVLFVINTTRAEMHGVFSTAAPPGYRLHASAFPRSAGSEPLVAQMPVGRCGPALAPLAEASFGDVLGAGWQRALEPEGAALPRPRDGTVLAPAAPTRRRGRWTRQRCSCCSRASWSSRTRRRDGAPSRQYAVAAPPKPFPVGISSVRAQASRRLRSARRRPRRRPAQPRAAAAADAAAEAAAGRAAVSAVRDGDRDAGGAEATSRRCSRFAADGPNRAIGRRRRADLGALGVLVPTRAVTPAAGGGAARGRRVGRPAGGIG